MIDAKKVADLRAKTGIGLMVVKKALQEANGDENKALEILKKQGEKIALKKQTRSTNQGLVECYMHSNKKIASVVVLLCETDFVAKTDDFKNLIHDLAMQVAATNPQYLSPETVPAEILEKEKEIWREQLTQEKKPVNIQEKIIEGKVNKFYQEVCLVKQVFIKDDKITIEKLIEQVIAKLGENIKIKEFKRFEV